jgi:hypothetical protein
MAGHSLAAQSLTFLDHYVREGSNVPFDQFLMKGCGQLLATGFKKWIRLTLRTIEAAPKPYAIIYRFSGNVKVTMPETLGGN